MVESCTKTPLFVPGYGKDADVGSKESMSFTPNVPPGFSNASFVEVVRRSLGRNSHFQDEEDSNQVERAQHEVKQNLLLCLQDANHQMENDEAENDTVTSNTVAGTVVPVAAGAGDTNICGRTIQLYWNSILGRCLDADEDVRQSTLKIVEIVLRQGLVHPITCVPYLIALETDPQEANAKLAHHLQMNMNEKYSLEHLLNLLELL